MQLNNRVRVALVVVSSLVFIGFIVSFYQKHSLAGEEILFRDVSVVDAEQTTDNGVSSGNRIIYVHIAGAVRKPGVYPFKAGTRVFQALKRAGGTTDTAVLESFNLAAPLEDGAKLYIPSQGENSQSQNQSFTAGSNGVVAGSGMTYQAQSSGKSSRSSSNKLKTPGEGYVDINAAGQAELTRLPGVGPSTAAKIVEYRNSIGRFSSPQQLMEVKGIGPKKFAKMQPFITCQ